MDRILTDPSRRAVLAMLGSAGIAPSLARAQASSGVQVLAVSPGPDVPAAPLTLVSRHLQWTSIERGIEVAVEAGFPAIAWTVRPGAHIDPQDVERELPRVVDLTHKAGLATPMIITQIADSESPRADAILETMRGLGISRFRAGSGRYDLSQPIPQQLASFQNKLAGLARLSERHDATAMLHTHSRGNQIGGSGWDMWFAVRDLDPRYIGINFDVGHVTAKGGAGLLESLRAARIHVQAISLKDLVWRRMANPDPAVWPWETYFVPPGEGMVNFRDIFAYLAETRFTGPLEMYFEYEVEIPGRAEPMDMLGTNFGEWELELPQSQFIALLRRDVQFYRRLLAEAGLSA